MSRIRRYALLAVAAYVASRFMPRRHKEMGSDMMREHEAMARKRGGSVA